MNIIKHFTPLIKDKELIDNLPIVIRVVKFDESSAKEFSVEMSKAQNSGQPIVPVIIDSYGGQVYSLMSMISDVRHSKIPVATIVQGKAMSCGSILASFGAEGKRYMDPDATVMIHDVSSMMEGKIEDLKADAKEADRLNKKIFRMMAENCGQEEEHFLDIIHQKGHAEWYLTAEECKRHNIVNHAHVPTLQIKVGIEFSFK